MVTELLSNSILLKHPLHDSRLRLAIANNIEETSPMKKTNKEEIVEAQIVNDEIQEEPSRSAKKKKKKKRGVEKFELALSNGLLAGVFSVGLIVAFLVFREKTTSSIITLCAFIFMLVFIPATISFISWSASKNKSTSTMAFNILIVLVFLSNISFMIFASRNSSAKKADEMLQVFKSENEEATQKWNASFQALGEPRMRNLLLLKNQGEFLYRRNLINEHKKETIAYMDYCKKKESDLNRRLLELTTNDPSANAIYEQVIQHIDRRSFTAGILATKHITLANALLEVLDTLETKPAAWTITGSQLVISDSDILNKMNSLGETIDTIYEEISKYSTRLNQIR